MMKPACLLLVILTAIAPAFAAPACKSVQRYEGPPLHAAPTAEAFPGAARSTTPVEADQAARLNAVMSAFDGAAHPPAVSAALLTETGRTWTATAPSGDPSPLFYWASAGKAWTALAILQLAEEGRISLSDTLAKWAPDYPNARLITIDQLLTHTSGAYTFNADEAFRAKPGYKSAPEEVAAAASHPADFCPGRSWAYSNTGYVLLGQIIEAVDGRPLTEALFARIVTPLGLENTRILGPEASLDGIAPLTPTASATDGANDDMRTPGAAGPVAASAADMARFWYASLSGELLSAQATRDRFTRLYPMFGNPAQAYGRGVMLYDVPASPNTPADTWLGHSGGLPGAKSVIIWSLAHRAVVAVALTGDGPAEALANRLLAALD
jgi:D-alanyl-D-alanine carboxypeptidase